jgi:glutamate N-acetyltransferase/amino-acid N-acetyltransferase
MKIITGNICAPKGFLASGTFAGIKRNATKKDVALIYSEEPAVAAAMFTTNQVKAAPLLLTQQHLQQTHKLQAVIVNSGNANACTGEQGMRDAIAMANTTAAALKIKPEAVAVSSTGVIGVPLPIEKITSNIGQAVDQLSATENLDAAIAIMTTDTFPKPIAVECEIAGKTVRIGGITKGSGMIHPMMATMLAFITTDVAISQEALQHALKLATDASFHMITVDGESSTNDMVLILANGMAGNAEISSIESPEWQTFFQALQFVCIDLAKQIAKDGEGATKLIEVHLSGASTLADARIAARNICRSSLVKAAVFGEDANWGRIVSAIGASGIVVHPEKISVSLEDLNLFKQGQPVAFDEALARTLLQEKTVRFFVDLGMGEEKTTAWGCDLTYDYVKINASYRT